MRVVLDVMKGPQAGTRFQFDRHDTFMIGRSPKVHLHIPDDPYFSRYHFMIEVNPPECFLRDLGSRNGTFINGCKVRQADLKDGDTILGGKSRIKVRLEEPAQAAAKDQPRESDKDTPPVAQQRQTPTPLSMRTTFSSDLQGEGEAGKLRCAVCGKLAEDTKLGELSDTRMVAYVCEECYEKNTDQKHPIPNFEVLDELGHGSLGPVFKARRLSTGKLVALKILPPHVAQNPQATQLFLREMQLGARLSHPSILPIIEIGEAGDDLWIATEFAGGVNAAELARSLGGTVPLPDAVDIICQILDALDHAHGLNLVHRDVKPPNIMVTGEAGAYTAKLGDFGLMKNVDEAGLSGITRRGEIRGTVPFMPPEQVCDCRFVKPSGDIYQAGATLYWLLTGEYVYDFDAVDPRGETKDPFLVILDEPVIPIRRLNPSILQPVAQAVETSLRREPEDRFETAAEMARSLREAVS